LDGRRGKKVQNVLGREREREIIEHMIEDGREIRWMKEIWNRRERIEKERNCILMFVIRNPKARRANKTFYILKKMEQTKPIRA
jgi:hypothetical protein